MAETGLPERSTASALFLLPWDHHGWSSDIGGLTDAPPWITSRDRRLCLPLEQDEDHYAPRADIMPDRGGDRGARTSILEHRDHLLISQLRTLNGGSSGGITLVRR